MGLFDKKDTEEKEYIKKIEDMLSYINEQSSSNLISSVDAEFINFAKEVSRNPEITRIKPVKLCAELMSAIVYNKKDFQPKGYFAIFKNAEELYTKMFPLGENTEDFEEGAYVLLNMFRENGLYKKKLFNISLYNTFKNKQNYIDFMDTVKEYPRTKECLYDIIQYAISVRALFLDDYAYTANMKDVATRLILSEDRQTIIATEQKRAEHMAGIYDIDETSVAKAEQNIAKTNAMLKESFAVLEQAEAKINQLSRMVNDSTDSITDASKRASELISMKASTAKDDINSAYNSFLEEQRQEVILQKDVLLGQIFNEAENKLKELRSMARAITVSANSELLKINTETSIAMDKISNLMSNDKELEKVLAKADENKELYDKIAKLELLNTQNIETMVKNMEPQVVANAVTQEEVISTSSYIPAASTEMEPQAIPEVNPLLDQSIPFETRFKMVMEEKQRRIAKGEHFHKMFDDVITVLMEDANPYMIGPSGCGKTFMVKQISSILSVDFIDIGYINEEYDILGFQTATGAYSTPNFYRCYKYGKIAFCDELDNGNSRATVKLNSFLSNGKDACYSFPHGENVKRHENFRIIAAGNTTGNGADANYNTREKIEESVQQRFTPVYVGYDNYVEEQILGEYKDWYQFCVLFRQATDSWGSKNDCAAPGIITTRDTARIRKYLDNKSLTMGKILDYEFIQTKDMEYLAYITRYIRDNLDSAPGAREIFNMFEQKVNELREKGGIR